MVDEAKHQISGVFSTESIDRHGEVINQAGWDVSEYLLNPVILWQHRSCENPIGQCIALSISNGELVGTIQFAVDEDKSQLAETVFNLYKGGYMRAFSVGFECTDDSYDMETGVVTLNQNKLYEISCVSIPANAEALALQKGIDTAVLHDKKVEVIEEKKVEVAEVKAVEIKTPILKRANIAKAKKSPAAKGGYSANAVNKVLKALLKDANTRKINKAIRALVNGKKEIQAKR